MYYRYERRTLSLEDATYQAKHLQKMYADLDKPSKPSDVHKEEEESYVSEQNAGQANIKVSKKKK